MEVTVLTNDHSFDQQLLAEAVAVPSGAFIEVDDLTFELNGMGRKIAQTLQVVIEDRAVSMAYIGGSGCELVLACERPVVLGTYASLLQHHGKAYQRLLDACEDTARLSPQETVTALLAMTRGGLKSANDAVAWARTHTRRSAWVLENRLEATSSAPVIWASLGL